jgi:hypothetical protein
MDNKMKTLGMLLASAAVCGSAHATVYQYAYTATIQEMLEFSAVTGSGGMVNASSWRGTLAVGDSCRAISATTPIPACSATLAPARSTLPAPQPTR